MQNSFKAVECCNAILLLRLLGVATQHSFWGLGSCFLHVRIAALLSFFLSCAKTEGRQKKKGRKKKRAPKNRPSFRNPGIRPTSLPLGAGSPVDDVSPAPPNACYTTMLCFGIFGPSSIINSPTTEGKKGAGWQLASWKLCQSFLQYQSLES